MDEPVYDIAALKALASGERKQHRQVVRHLKRCTPREADRVVHTLHEQWMERVDCLQCAHCCKTLSPAVHDSDIGRMAKYLRMKPSELVEKYYRTDEDGDYVFTRQPCPFLGDDNYCSIYEVRPRACREYPHTDRPRIRGILDLSLRNAPVCPVVYGIFHDLKDLFL